MSIYKLKPRLKLSIIFIGTILLMLAYEFVHELISNGLLTSLESDSKPILMTAFFAAIVLLSTRLLAEKADEQLSIAAVAFESQNGMAITDSQNTILRVNRAFTEITGYPAEEVICKNLLILNSGRHDVNFFAAMWDSINLTGGWEGEIWNRRKNGEIYPEYLTITAVKNRNGSIINYVSSFADITLRKTSEEKINSLAFYDPLTNLPNRRLLLNKLSKHFISSGCCDNEGALLFIGLDNFKLLNDVTSDNI